RQPRLPRGRGGPVVPAHLRARARTDHRDGHPRPGGRRLRRARGAAGRRLRRRGDLRPDARLRPGRTRRAARRGGGGTMIRLTWAQMRRSVGRLAAAAVAIVVGTAFVTATLLAGALIE